MDKALWVLQIALGIKFVSVAFTHGLRQGQPTMAEAIERMGARARGLLAVVAVLTFLGGVGLVLPGALSVLPWATPLTAALLAVLVLGSILLHVRSREEPKVFASVILLVLVVFVAYGRWALAPM